MGDDPQIKNWEMGDGQKRIGRWTFLIWEMGDEEIKLGDGRWVKSLGRLLNGVKTCIFRAQWIRFYQILGATRQFQYANA